MLFNIPPKKEDGLIQTILAEVLVRRYVRVFTTTATVGIYATITSTATSIWAI